MGDIDRLLAGDVRHGILHMCLDVGDALGLLLGGRVAVVIEGVDGFFGEAEHVEAVHARLDHDIGVGNVPVE